MKPLLRFTVMLIVLSIISPVLMAGDINKAGNGEQAIITAVIIRIITYQGILKTAAGSPVPVTYNLTFRIYKQSSGGVALWTSSSLPVSISGGLF